MSDQPAAETISRASSTDLNDWNVLVGRVKARWDRAALKVVPYSSAPGRFEAGARLCAVQGERRRLLEIRGSRPQGHTFLLDCGLPSVEAAEALRGAELFVHPSMRPPLPPGEFYLDELIGMQVRTESGESWGEIEEVLETPAHNVYVTPRAMIPGLPEFIVATDWENRVLVVREMPGLLKDE
jgi:16S rRNA processing protein RimM